MPGRRNSRVTLNSHRRSVSCTAIIACLALANTVAGQTVSEPLTKHWIFFKDDVKRLDSRPAVISEAARKRRAMRGSGTTASIDYGVPDIYLDELRSRGVQIEKVSRWFNAVSARMTHEQMADVKSLPFVRRVQVMGTIQYPTQGVGAVEEELYVRVGPLALDPGPSEIQLALVNAIGPIESGIDGSGVRLGFLDTPYLGLEHPSLQHLHERNLLIEIRDFTGREQTHTHGQSVVSVAAGFQEGQLIGPAHGAEVLAAVTEYVPSETNAEEDFFVAGLEWLEAEGADVVNVSLGYTTFDPGERDYTVDDLNGDIGITTRAVDRAAALGVVVVVAAGNEGCLSPGSCWYYVSTPADADSAIAVGAVTEQGARASFSSRGPTADGRIKPDVAALGTSVYVAVPGGYARSGGTSFAAPMVSAVAAQMLQMNPDLGPIALREILRQTASRSHAPDNELGWGVINAESAIQTAIALSDENVDTELVAVRTYPNPATDFVFIHINRQFHRLDIRVYDVLGRVVDTQSASLHFTSDGTISLSTAGLSSGVYVFSLSGEDFNASGKFVVVR